MEPVTIPLLGLMLGPLVKTGFWLSIVIELESLAESPELSVTVAVHWMASPGLLFDDVNCRVSLPPMIELDVRFCQLYEVVDMLPSGSVPVAMQVSNEPLLTPVLGVIETAVTVGALFSTITDAESLSVPPEESETIAVH